MICPPADLDFNGTTLTLELKAELAAIPADIAIPVYSDGVPEGVEGFVVLLGVLREDLDARDVGFVDVLSPIVLVRLEEGGAVKPGCSAGDNCHNACYLCRLQV